eukprot:GEZU01019122.1.p1 GENE.GEZU01019122.1~~GEZU01019122.1.p1  ORF type:complete len:879 (+),score=335.10 GEZU01019122.1:1515-4151(+)
MGEYADYFASWVAPEDETPLGKKSRNQEKKEKTDFDEQTLKDGEAEDTAENAPNEGASKEGDGDDDEDDVYVSDYEEEGAAEVADSDDDGLEARYEAKLRRRLEAEKAAEELEEEEEIVEKLPVKGEDGTIKRVLEKEKKKRKREQDDDEGDEDDDNAANDSDDPAAAKAEKARKKEELRKQRAAAKRLQEERNARLEYIMNDPKLRISRQLKIREHIANIATKVLENPPRNIALITQIHEFSEDRDSIVRQLAILSELALFKDLIPGYRIRIATEKESSGMLSKEVKELRAFEEGLLTRYQKFLQYIDRAADDLSKPQLRVVSIKCMCELLTSAPHFNFRTNLIAAVVPLLNEKDNEIAEMCFESVANLFQTDTTNGEATLEVVELIAKFAKDKDFKVRATVLDVFLHLNLNTELHDKSFNQFIKNLSTTRKTAKKLIAKRQRRKVAEEEELKREMEMAEAVQSNKERKLIQTDTLRHVILTYVRLLKKKIESKLLFSALKGLAKFSHLINLELLRDVLANLNTILEIDHLPLNTALQALITACRLLTGPGAALDVDLSGYYSNLYRLMLSPMVCSDDESSALLVSALVTMLLKPRLIPTPRAAAFVKKMCSLALLARPHVSLALLSIISTLMQRYKRIQQMTDSEHAGLGTYDPFCENPEHANALATQLWELYALTSYYHPVVRSYASEIIKYASEASNTKNVPRPALTNSDAAEEPMQLFAMYNQGPRCKFNPKLQPLKKHALYEKLNKMTNKQQKSQEEAQPNKKKKKKVAHTEFVFVKPSEDTLLRETQSEFLKKAFESMKSDTITTTTTTANQDHASSAVNDDTNNNNDGGVAGKKKKQKQKQQQKQNGANNSNNKQKQQQQKQANSNKKKQ